MEIRIRETGAVVRERQFRAMHPNTSFPPKLSEQTINDFGGDVVLEGPQATDLEWWQQSQRSGVEEINGKWFTKYIAGPVFETPEEQAAYVAERTQQRAEGVYAEIVNSVQKRLDDFAITRNYDGILSACTYATSTVPKFAAEGQYCVEARDTAWDRLYQILAEVEAGTRPVPSGYEDIESELPPLNWPE